MPIHVSKKSFEHQPLSSNAIAVDQQIPPTLKSDLLRNSRYLSQLRNDVKTGSLKPENSQQTPDAIKRVKIALNIIDQYADIPGRVFDIPNGPLDASSGDYDEALTQAVELFQEAFEVQTNQRGIVDAQTLDRLDAFVDPNVLIDIVNFNLIGRVVDKNLEVVTSKSLNGEYTFKILVNGMPFDYKTLNPMPMKPVLDHDGNFNRNFVSDSDELSTYSENPINTVGTPAGTLILEGQPIHYSLEGENDTLIKGTNQPLTEANLSKELDRTPPSILPIEVTELYTVKEDDQLIDLIKDRYYGDEKAITSPFDDQLVYTLPSRGLSEDPTTRPYDARLQFYINLIYYYNSPEDDNGNVTHYGIRAKTNYTRYADSNLNGYNIFDNFLDPDITETALPNYYRFLAHQNSNGSAIRFDNEGQASSFEMVPGEKLWFPSREFAEALYYHLNFRPGEMLKTSLDGVIDYVTESELAARILNLIESVLSPLVDAIGAAIDFLIDQTRELIEETLKFFKAVYNYAVDNVAKFYPRGLGARLGGGVGITWGIPIATNVDAAATFWRKMSQEDELIFAMRAEFTAFVGVDTGVGYNIGFVMGSGKKKSNLGLQLGAGGSRGSRPNLNIDFELPIRREETGLLTMLITVFGPNYKDGNRTGDKMTRVLSAINLDPLLYLTRFKYGFGHEIKTWASIGAGLNENGEANPAQNIQKIIPDIPPAVPQSQDKSFLSMDNIWDKIPGMGILGNNIRNLGIELEFKAKYDKNPLVPEVGGRVASEVEIQTQFVVANNTTISGMGNLLQRMLLSPVVLPLQLLLGIFNFGFGLGLNAKWTRKGLAKDIQLSDTDFNHLADDLANIPPEAVQSKGQKLLFGTDQGEWETTLFMSKFTGDVEALFTLGSETKINFNTKELRKRLFEQSSDQDLISFHTIDTIFDIIHSIEIQSKPGIGVNARTRKKFATTLGNTIGKLEGQQRDILSPAKKAALDLFFGVYLKIEFEIESLRNIIKYYLKRWYLMITRQSSWNPSETGAGNRIALDELFTNIETEVSKDKTLDNVEKRELIYTRILEDMSIGVLDDEDKVLLEAVPDELNAAEVEEGFRDAFKELMTLPTYLLVNLAQPGDPIDRVSEDIAILYNQLKIEELFNEVNTLGKIINVTVLTEGKAGGAFGFKASAAAGGKIRFAPKAEISVINRLSLLDDNEPHQLSQDDSYQKVYDELKRYLNIDSSSPQAIRNALQEQFPS